MTLLGDQSIPFAQGNGWKATELMYAGSPGGYGYAGPSSLAMTLILPDDLTRFEKHLSTATLKSVTSGLASARKRQQTVIFGGPDDCGHYPYALEVDMPRFGIETRAELVPILEELGMSLATDASSADFSGITTADRIFIQKVIHQANIDVDEKGTEAAAATAVEMGVGGCTGPEPAKTIAIRLDRPFLFLIRDVRSGAILFMGRVVDPSIKR